MHNKVVISEHEQGYILLHLMDNKAVHYGFFRKNSLINSIGAGRIEKVDKNLSALFVITESGERVCIPFSSGNTYKQNELVPYAVKKEKTREKTYAGDLHISLTGRYVVLIESKRARYSNKLDDTIKTQLNDLLNEVELPKGYSILFRTSCSNLTSDKQTLILKEIHVLSDTMNHFIQKASVTNRPFSQKDELGDIYLYLYDLEDGDFEEIETDSEELYQSLLNHSYSLTHTVKLYSDDEYSLKKLYNLDDIQRELLSPKVWLKSGAFIYIEKTEAATIIDVNSGKSIHYAGDDYYYKINKEAAREIIRQIILRNLSGVILVDFINMKDTAHESNLIEYMNQLAQSDKKHLKALDFTSLGIMQLIRDKKEMNIYEINQILKGEELS